MVSRGELEIDIFQEDRAKLAASSSARRVQSYREQNAEVVQLLREALELCETACKFDNMMNSVAACDYYDKTILHLDETLNRLPMACSEYGILMELRSKYETRMETLRAVRFIRFDDLGRFTLLHWFVCSMLCHPPLVLKPLPRTAERQHSLNHHRDQNQR